MSKIIVLGDTHGRSFWKLILNTQEWDKAIFIGDYFDSFDIDSETQQRNFREIAQFAEKEKDRVVLLIGNHDEHYFPFMGYSGTSGYQGGGAAPAIGHLLMTYKDLLKMAHSEENILFTHAGVGESWLEDCVENRLDATARMPTFTAKDVSEFVNDVWRWKPFLFKFTGRDDTGDDMGQTPIWIRPRSLARDSQDMMKQGIIQVVGHTGQRKIDIGGVNPRAYVFIDTLGTSGEYLIIEDGIFKTKKT